MGTFRGSDEQVDREIETLERIAKLRLRRYAGELRDLDRDLSELRKERARRRTAQMETANSQASQPSAA
jgi:hypothetical protein